MPTAHRTNFKTVEVRRDLHRELKEAAARNEQSVNAYAEQALRERLARERREDR